MKINPDEVYIVDDDPVQIIIAKKILQKGAFCKSITSFPHGKAAFQHFQQLPQENKPLPKVLLLDLNMPVWDGWDFLDAMKLEACFKDLSVIIVTSSGFPQDIQKAHSYSMVKGLIKKPITVENLGMEMEKVFT